MLSQFITFLWFFTCLSWVHCACPEFSPCTVPGGHKGLCHNGTCIPLIYKVRNNLRFMITVKYPESLFKPLGIKNLYIRGNSLGLSWTSGVMLNKTGTDTWQTLIVYQSADDGFRCQFCADRTPFTGDTFQYRINYDDTGNMVGGNFEHKIPISLVSPYFQKTPEFFAYPYFFSESSSITSFTIESTEIGGNRSVVIYKPPSFQENTYKMYPTLIAFDVSVGSAKVVANVFDEEITRGTVQEMIMIGFGDYGSSPTDRDRLMTQVEGPQYDCINGTYLNRCDNCVPKNATAEEYLKYMREKCGRYVLTGGQGNDTLDFLINTALPKAKQLTGKRMRTDQPNLGVVGYSLGGLMACHAAWTRPEVFGSAACQSPSFWWPLNNDSTAEFFFNNISLQDPVLRANRPPQRIYLDAGGNETYRPYTLSQAMVSAAKEMGSLPSFQWDHNLWASVYPGDIHGSLQWIQRAWKSLRVLYPAHPAPVPETAPPTCASPETNGSDVARFYVWNLCSIIFIAAILHEVF